MTLDDRFFSKVREIGECWEWSAYRDHHGYGKFRTDSGPRLAHRLSWQFFRGAIPEGLALDHLCRNRACVNPDHLDPVTIGVNVQRGAEEITSCPQGHPYDSENTYRPARGGRQCRTCKNAQAIASRRRARAKG